jgi:hypothetical protein
MYFLRCHTALHEVTPPLPASASTGAVAAKVLQYHASGMLGKLTVPELKAFLKSVRQPVGGKKGDLEERVRVHLGGPPAAAAALVSI